MKTILSRGYALPLAAALVLFPTSGFGALTAPPVLEMCPIADADKVGARASVTLADRVAAFWKAYEVKLYFPATPNVRTATDEHWHYVEVDWEAYARADKDPARRAAVSTPWKAAVKKHWDGIRYLSGAQLDVLSCYLRRESGALDDGELAAAMNALALGTNAKAASPQSGRMNSIKAWFEWGGFVESYFQGDEARRDPLADENWMRVRRAILYGALIHAHHDTLTAGCPGNTPCYRRPTLRPADLKGTTQEEIRQYVYGSNQLDQAGVARVLGELAFMELNNPSPAPMFLSPGAR